MIIKLVEQQCRFYLRVFIEEFVPSDLQWPSLVLGTVIIIPLVNGDESLRRKSVKIILTQSLNFKHEASPPPLFWGEGQDPFLSREWFSQVEGGVLQFTVSWTNGLALGTVCRRLVKFLPSPERRVTWEGLGSLCRRIHMLRWRCPWHRLTFAGNTDSTPRVPCVLT